MTFNQVLLTIAGPAGDALKAALAAVPGVVRTSVAPGEARVSYDPDTAGIGDLKEAATRAGSRVTAFQVIDDDDFACFSGG